MGDGTSTPDSEDPSKFDEKTSPPVSAAGGGQQSLADFQSSDSSGSQPSPGKSSTPQQSPVTQADQAELSAHSNKIQDPLDASSPTPAEFSRQAFADGVQARRIQAGEDGHEALPIDSDSTQIGGWNSLDQDDIVEREPLSESDDTGGRTEQVMERADLQDSPDRAANEAYVTNYDHDWNHPNAPTMVHAHSQMATYSALDAMGVQAPRHSYNAETQEVFVESVDHPQYDAVKVENVSAEYADRIDPDQMKDIMAANLVVGNGDLKEDNLMVGEDGSVVPFDFDWTRTEHNLARAESSWGDWVDRSISNVNGARTEPLGFESTEVFDRAEEIATQLRESGAVDRVAEAAAEYDEFFIDNEPLSTGQYDTVGKRIQSHVKNWSK